MRHTRREFLQAAGAGLALAGAGRMARGRAVGEKPNIIYMMSDELGYFEPGCMGNPYIRTPNIDRLAAEGVLFTQGLAGAPVCAPTRCCLMTGKHAGHTSVRTNGGSAPLRAGEETIASVLKRAGYATGGFGKWGCGGRGSTGVPEKHGFDIFVGYYDQVHAHSYYTPYLIRNSKELPLEGNEGGRKGKTYSHYVIWNEAVRFVRANKDRPFFCYLPVTPPHGMFDIPDSDPAWALYKEKDWPEDARRYAAMVSMIDRQLGELRALLKQLGIEKNTLIFFCGDNGGADYFRSPDRPKGFFGANRNPKTGKIFRGHKGNLYEGGLRIPMMACWPGRIRPGRVSDLLWYFPDVLPTLAELAGAKAPKDIDGISIVPELIGEDAAGRKQPTHEMLYWEFGGWTAVRMGKWKAVRPPKKAWELYDLETDIEESNDLAGRHGGVLAKMTAFAEKAHTPAQPGTFLDPAPNQKDRRAKWGSKQPAQRKRRAGKVHAMPTEGLIPRENYRIVRASSESTANGKLARCAIDGDPMTWWHSDFAGSAKTHPHELVIDLGREYEVRGLRYLPRQDTGWNGTIARCELYVGSSPTDFGEPMVKATFRRVKTAQDATGTPTRGRYVLLRTLAAFDDGPWASIAELGIIGR